MNKLTIKKANGIKLRSDEVLFGVSSNLLVEFPNPDSLGEYRVILEGDDTSCLLVQAEVNDAHQFVATCVEARRANKPTEIITQYGDVIVFS